MGVLPVSDFLFLGGEKAERKGGCVRASVIPGEVSAREGDELGESAGGAFGGTCLFEEGEQGKV